MIKQITAYTIVVMLMIVINASVLWGAINLLSKIKIVKTKNSSYKKALKASIIILIAYLTTIITAGAVITNLLSILENKISYMPQLLLASLISLLFTTAFIYTYYRIIKRYYTTKKILIIIIGCSHLLILIIGITLLQIMNLFGIK